MDKNKQDACEGCTVTTGEKKEKKIDVGWKQPSVAGLGPATPPKS
jgi:hypothetical protein